MCFDGFSDGSQGITEMLVEDNEIIPMAMLTPLRLNMGISSGISPIVAIFAVESTVCG